MSSGKKALGFLLIMAGVVSNPWVLAKLFSNDGQITTAAVVASVILAELIIVLLGVSFWIRGKNLLINLGVLLFSCWLTLAFTIVIDRAYGRYIMPETADFLFPAFSVANHNTNEFDLTVRINNLGFRGPNTSIEKHRKRVLLIGDSFTFGWGVELENTWVHLLSEKYPSIEFLNLGQGGNHPGDYVQIAKRTFPVLKPDLVLINVLQGNDNHQLMRVIEFEEAIKNIKTDSNQVESNRAKLQRYLGIIYPNFTKRFLRIANIQQRWKTDAAQLLFELTKEQKEKYISLELEIKSAFENGQLNPSLLDESLNHPNMFLESVDTSNALCKKGIIRMHDHLKEIKDLCKQTGCNLIILDLPNRPYGFPKTLKVIEALGYYVPGCDTLNASLPTQLAVNDLQTPLISSSLFWTEDPLFYQYDGHWNAEGNRIFAQELNKSLEQDSTWKHFLTSSSF